DWNCFWCGAELTTARKVKIRPWCDFDEALGGPDCAAYRSYVREATFRWSPLCQGYDLTLDNATERAEVSGRLFNLAGASRVDKTTTVDEEKFRKFLRREAEQLGIEIDEEE